MTLTFTPLAKSDIPAVSMRSGSATGTFINEFMASGAEACEITLPEAKEGAKTTPLNTTRSTIQTFISAHRLSLRLRAANGNLYLERITDEEAAALREKAAETTAKREATKASNKTNGTTGEVASDSGTKGKRGKVVDTPSDEG